MQQDQKLNFDDLVTIESNDKFTTKVGIVDFSTIVDVSKKLTKEQKEELKKIEPGFHIPVLNYKQIGCWCEHCEDTTPQVLNDKQTKIRCLKCKKDKII